MCVNTTHTKTEITDLLIMFDPKLFLEPIIDINKSIFFSSVAEVLNELTDSEAQFSVIKFYHKINYKIINLIAKTS